MATGNQNDHKNENKAEPAKEQPKVQAELTEHQLRMQAIEAELKELELSNAKLSLELKGAELVDTRERLQERELKRENLRQEAYTKGATLKSTKAGEEKQQARCNHKKGGNGAQGVVGGLGDDSQYAVLKHKFAHGDIWVRCLRCGKTWKPPIKSRFINNPAGYEAAMSLYKEAVNFQTRNVTSGGIVFQFSDGGEFAREQMASTNLR